MSNVTGVTTLTGANIFAFNAGSPAYLMLTSQGAVSLTDQLSSLVLDSTVASDTLIGITEDSAANAAQVVIDNPGGSSATLNTYEVEAQGSGSTAIGFQAVSAQSLTSLTINGTTASGPNAYFFVTATQTAIGAQMGGGAFTNNGLVEVDSQNSATGVMVAGVGSVTNNFQIHLQALNAVGLSFASASGASFTNSNNAILQADALSGGSSTGIAFGGAYVSGQWLTITNNGDLHANTAIKALTTGVTTATPIVHLTNAGSIEGDIHLGIGPSQLDGAGSQVVNNGLISGSVFLDTNGADLYDSGQGAGSATAVYLGAGTDTVHFGSAGGVVHVAAGAAVITGTTGAITVYGGSGAETVTGSSSADYIQAGTGNDALTGGGGADTFAFGPTLGSDVVTDFSAAQGDTIDLSALFGMQTLGEVLAVASQQGSNTVLSLGGGSVTLDNVSMNSLTAADFGFHPAPTTVTGSAANNYTVTVEGVLREYSVGAEGAYVTGGPDNVNDTLTGMNRIQFVDGYLSYSPTSTAGEVYRIYEATLGRGPDPAGLAFWVNGLDTGTVSLQTVAGNFVGSTEFQADYGGLSNTDFVTLLYNNVLHRAPDTDGLNFWVNGLNSGAATEAQVVLGFTEAQEDINASAGAVGQGLWVGNVDAAEVARLYDTMFSRLPDLAGLTSWTQALENGTETLLQEVNSFMASTEFQADYGGLSNTAFVTLLYENALHRAPDSAGLNSWVNALNTGGDTRAQVVLAFSEGAEHVADTAPHIDNGIWVS